MAIFSDKAAIAICDRCSFKFAIDKLKADGNSPGLRVCDDCRDPKDPWRFAPLMPDAIALRKPRPDTNIALNAPLHPLDWDTPNFTWDSGLNWDQEV